MHTAAVDSSVERGTWPFLRASSRRFGVACSVRSAPVSAMTQPSVQRAQEFESLRQQLREALLHGPDAGEHDQQARRPAKPGSRPRTGSATAPRGSPRRTRGSTMSSAVTPGSATAIAPANNCAAPEHEGPQSLRWPRPGRADGQRVKPCDQQFDEREMAVQREERERGQDDVELAQRRRAAAAQRVDVERERQAHAVGEQLAGQRRARRRQSAARSRAPRRSAAAGSPRRSPAARTARWPARGISGATSAVIADREHDARARRHEARAEHRRHHQAGADAREREEALRHPALRAARW